MNKILQSGSTGDINVTNDGATILKAIQLDNAAAKILVNISKVQDDEVGDGTTSVCVLAAELLREAEKLIAQRIHPQTIIEGYRIASAAALAALEKSAVDNSCVFGIKGFFYKFGVLTHPSSLVVRFGFRADPVKFRQDLFNIARTTLSSKVLSQDKDYFSNLAVDAVLRLKVCGLMSIVHLYVYTFLLSRVQRTSITSKSSKKWEASLLTPTWTKVSQANLPGTVVLMYRDVCLRFHIGQSARGELSKEARKCQHPHCKHM